jgi:hypothetical protein
METNTFGVYLAAFLTIGIYSFLYKDNPLYKMVEHLFVGVSAGYLFARQYNDVLLKKLIDKLAALPDLLKQSRELSNYLSNITDHSSIDYVYLDSILAPQISSEIKMTFLLVIPAALGIMMLLRLVPSIAWVSRWAMSFVVGVTSGLAIILFLQANAIAQIKAALGPLVIYDEVKIEQKLIPDTMSSNEGSIGNAPAVDMPENPAKAVADDSPLAVNSAPESKYAINFLKSFNAIMLFLGTFTALLYFFFSVEHKGLFFGGGSKLGIWFLMVSFGASFGYTIMGRISLLIGRMQFLLGDVLHIIK